MTEKTITPQQIHEFIENLLDDVRAGRITPEGALIASQQYEYLHAVLVENSDAIAGTFSDEKKFKSAITEVLEGALVRVKKELPQFQNETPNQPFSPETIVARAKTLRVAREDASSAIARQQSRVATLKDNFINRLINNWIAQTRVTTDKERQQSIARDIREKLEKAPLSTMQPPEINRFIQKTLTNTRLNNESMVIQKEFIRETKKLSGLREIPRVLVSRADISHPDWFTSIAIQTGSVSQADTLARQAEVLVSPVAQKRDVPDETFFFRAFASTPVQIGFAAVADALLQQISPLGRQEVIKETFSRTIDGLLAKTDLLTERLGQDFVKSELFRLVVDETRKSFTQETGGPSGAGQIRGAFEDVIGSVLLGPILPRLIGTPQEMVLSYFELLAVEARLPIDRKMLFPEHSPAVNSLFAALAPQPEFLGPHTNKPFTETQKIVGPVAALAAQFPSWQTLYLALLSEFSFSLSPSPVSQSQTSIGAPLISTPLGVFGGVFSSLGRVASGAAVGLSGGLLTMLFGGGLGALFGKNRGPDKPTPLLEDTPKLLAIIIVVSLVVLFVFPSFLNATFINNAAKNGALLVASQETPDFSGESNPSPDLSLVASECKGPDLPAPPADGVKTTQVGGHTYAFPVAPYDRTYYTCGHWDGGQATDIGINGAGTGKPHVGLAVVAYTDGVIGSTVLNDPKGGKYVILNGSNGESYYYAHNCSLYVKKGDHVSAGQVIAATGNTGSAAGTPEHLHFAITAAGRDFYNGGDACPAKDFKEKFGISKCGAEPLCPPRPPKK